ncbi:MAG: diaminopimelate epimerase, partial [Clostridium sp.]
MRFSKMHGLGNDFIIIENNDLTNEELSDIAKKVCNRNFSVGADGLLVVKKSSIADIKMDIINADGSYANMCGNGIRCFCKYVYEMGIINNSIINVETGAGVLSASLNIINNIVEDIRIDMGEYSFDKDKIGFLLDDNIKDYSLVVDNKEYRASTILIGVPHTVIYVNNIIEEEVVRVGQKIEKLPIYKWGTNVNFVKYIDDKNIEVRTWERGAGITYACGTGVTSSVMIGVLSGKNSNIVDAKVYAGIIRIEYKDSVIFMSGPAKFICTGEFDF